MSGVHPKRKVLLQPRPVAGQDLVEAKLEWRLEGMGGLLSDRFTRAESRADFRRTRDDGLAHDAGFTLQQNTVDALRRSKKMLSEQSTSKTKGSAAYEALTQARERQEEARRLHEQ